MRKKVCILLACLSVLAIMISGVAGLSASLLIPAAEADSAKDGGIADIVPDINIEDLRHYYINQDFGITVSVDPDTDVEAFFLRYGEWNITVPAGQNSFRISIPSEGYYTIYAQAILPDGTRTGEASADVFIESLGPAPAAELSGLPAPDKPHTQWEDLSAVVGSLPEGGSLDIALEHLHDDGSSSWLGYCCVNAEGPVVLFRGEMFDVPGTYCLSVTTSAPCYEPSLERYYFTVEEAGFLQLPAPVFSSFSQEQTAGDWWCFDFHRILADSGADEGVFILHIELCESNESGERGDCIGKYAVVDGILTIPASDFSEGYYSISGYFSALDGYLDSEWSDDYLIHLTHSEYEGPEISVPAGGVWLDWDNLFTFAPPAENEVPLYTADAYELRVQDIFGYVIISAAGLTENEWVWHCDWYDEDVLTLSVRARVGEQYTNWNSIKFEVWYADDCPLSPSIQSGSTLVPGEPLILLLSGSYGTEIYDIYVYRDDDPEMNPVIHVSHTVEPVGESPEEQSTPIDETIELDTSALTDGIYRVWIRASMPGFYPVEIYMPDEIMIVHVHAMEHTEAVEATCTQDGNTEYWYCSICEKYFADEEGTDVIKVDSWIVEKLGHDLEEHEVHKATCTETGNETYWSCSRCGKYFGDDEGIEEIEEDSWILEALGHDPVHHDAKAATCTEIGWDAYETCSQCDYTTYEEIPALGHDPVHHDAKAATCTEIGWDAYDICSRCDYTTYAEIPALGHDPVHHDAKAATCTEIGWDAYDTCSRCDYTTIVEIPALGHDPVHHDAKAATCTEIGWGAYETCTRCDHTTYVEIPALGHDPVHHDAKAATCTEIGWEAYDTCTRCDHTTYVEIPALGHDPVHHDAKAATCTEVGWDAYDTCSHCDYTTLVEIPALGHDPVHHEAKAATCSEIGWDAYDTCTRCDHTTYVEIPALGHDPVHHDAKAATCTEIGWDEYETCARCDHTTYAEIPALGHDLVHHEAKAPACEEPGWDAYDACTRCNYTTFVEIPALGHDWNDAVYTWSAAKTSVTAARICKNDESHIETETVGVTAVITAPAENAEGSAAYTSGAFTKEGFRVQTKSVTIPALKNLSVLLLPGMLRTVEDEAFSNLACQAVIIPEGCTAIGEHAFAGCAGLLYVRIPSTVTGYPENAFDNCNEDLVVDWQK